MFTAPTTLPDDPAALQLMPRAALAEIERLQLQLAGPRRNRFAQSLSWADPLFGRWPPGVRHEHGGTRHPFGCTDKKERLVRWQRQWYP